MIKKLVLQRIMEIVETRLFKKLDKSSELQVMKEDIEILKANSHPPMFSRKDHSDILKRLSILEKEK